MNRILAVVAFFALVVAACGVSRESDETLADDVTTTDPSGDGASSSEPSDEDEDDDAALTPTTLAPVAPATTGAPADVALTADFGDADWEITHGELNELVVTAQENEEFVLLVFGGAPPEGFDVGVLTQRLTAEAVAVELDSLGGAVTTENLDESRAGLLAQLEPLFVGVPDAADQAQRLYDEVPYLPFLVELQAGQVALSDAAAATAEPGDPVPCVRHILVETEAEADAAVLRLDGGDDFAELAQELSTGPSGPTGGDLGCVSSSSYVPPFAAAVDGAEIGVVAGPVQTDFGWHVILVEGEEPVEPDGRTLAGERLQQRLRAATVDVDAKLGTWDGDQLVVLPLAP